MPVIIDTDPGIDDALAILFALRHPDLDVLALCSVAGNIGLAVTTDNAGRLAALAGIAVPVHPGAEAPIGRDLVTEVAIHGDDGLGGVQLPEALVAPSGVPAVQAMADLLRSAPAGTIDLHCLGPLTNLAQLLETAPDAARRLRRVIAMGGAVAVPGNVPSGAEFNLGQDPVATKRVLDSALDLTLIPLDATRQFRADATYLQALRATGATAARICADLVEAYFTDRADAESRPLHDPCVPLLALHPELFQIETQALAADEAGRLMPGPRDVQVAMGVVSEDLRAVLLAGLAA